MTTGPRPRLAVSGCSVRVPKAWRWLSCSPHRKYWNRWFLLDVISMCQCLWSKYNHIISCHDFRRTLNISKYHDEIPMVKNHHTFSNTTPELPVCRMICYRLLVQAPTALGSAGQATLPSDMDHSSDGGTQVPERWSLKHSDQESESIGKFMKWWKMKTWNCLNKS